MRILVVEDEPALARHVARALAREGHATDVCHDGPAGLAAAQRTAPDLVVLDLNLPGLDGLDLLARLRAAGASARVLVLTARGEVDDRVKGLHAGADDYLTKPFGGRELLARVRAILRRVQAPNEPAVVRIGEIEIDQAARVVRRAGAEVHLTAKEYALLKLLVQHRGKVVTHRQILRELWGPNAEENTHYLRVFMTHLRAKLEAVPGEPRHLRTDAGIGYRLVE